MRRHDFEIEEFDSTLSPELCVSGELIDGGVGGRFLLRVDDDLAIVVVPRMTEWWLLEQHRSNSANRDN